MLWLLLFEGLTILALYLMAKETLEELPELRSEFTKRKAEQYELDARIKQQQQKLEQLRQGEL